jgi:hypothetical protein
MPVARRQGHTGRALAVAVAGVVLALGLAFGVALLANQGGPGGEAHGGLEVRLGDDVFPAGEAESLAEQISDGGPILFSDLVGGERDILLQHLADDPRRGWLAFAARPAGAPRECTVQWQADDDQFALLDGDGQVTGNCDGQTFPPDGTGLPQYPVDLRDGGLYVDLNAADRSTSTTT